MDGGFLGGMRIRGKVRVEERGFVGGIVVVVVVMEVVMEVVADGVYLGRQGIISNRGSNVMPVSVSVFAFVRCWFNKMWGFVLRGVEV